MSSSNDYKKSDLIIFVIAACVAILAIIDISCLFSDEWGTD